MTVSESYSKVPYDVRTAKQIERRMLLDAFLRLSAGGFPIREYQYTGFGSIFFVDFLLFRKYLGIRRMLSVEHSTSITKRVRFNRPFGDVGVEFGPIADFIPRLDADLRHLLWLDYDFVLNRDVLSDVVAASAQLTPGSILLITIDVEPPTKGTPRKWRQYFEAETGDLLDTSDLDFGRSNLPRVNAIALNNAIQNGLTGRKSIKFLPLFHFLYADGHSMLTIGGMLGSPSERRKLAACDLDEAYYLRRSFDSSPCIIRPPVLTRKERFLLDSHMPCSDGWSPTEFEIPKEHVKAYRELYPYFPLYMEALF